MGNVEYMVHHVNFEYPINCQYLNNPNCEQQVLTRPDWSAPISCSRTSCQATSFRHRDILVFYSGRSLRLFYGVLFSSSSSSKKPNVLLKDIATMIKGALQWCSMPSYYLSCMCIYLYIYIYIYMTEIWVWCPDGVRYWELLFKKKA